MLNKVWFTYKARIQAHHRLEWMDTHSQFLLVWYAILGAALAVVAIRYPTLLGKNTDIFGAIGIATFVQRHKYKKYRSTRRYR